MCSDQNNTGIQLKKKKKLFLTMPYHLGSQQLVLGLEWATFLQSVQMKPVLMCLPIFQTYKYIFLSIIYPL